MEAGCAIVTSHENRGITSLHARGDFYFFKGDIPDDRIAAVHSLSVSNDSVNIGLALGEIDAHDNLLAMCDTYNPGEMLGRLIPFKGDVVGYAGMVRAVHRGGGGSFYVQYGAVPDRRQRGARSTELYIAEAVSQMAAIATADILDCGRCFEVGGMIVYSRQKLGRLGVLLDSVLDPCS